MSKKILALVILTLFVFFQPARNKEGKLNRWILNKKLI